MAKHKYEGGPLSRYTYMTGYIEGQLENSMKAVVSQKWYRSKYNLSKTTFYKDKRTLDLFYPKIVWTK